MCLAEVLLLNLHELEEKRLSAGVVFFRHFDKSHLGEGAVGGQMAAGQGGHGGVVGEFSIFARLIQFPQLSQGVGEVDG